MQGGDADEFIDYLNDGEASVRHRGYVYRFSGLKFHPGRNTYSISVEKYRFPKSPLRSSWSWSITMNPMMVMMC